MTFDLLLENFNIGDNFFILRDGALIFGLSVPYDKAFPLVPYILNMWPWPWPLTYFWKTLTLPRQSYTRPSGALPDFVSILVDIYFKEWLALCNFLSQPLLSRTYGLLFLKDDLFPRQRLEVELCQHHTVPGRCGLTPMTQKLSNVKTYDANLYEGQVKHEDGW